jgi:Flp pilus assembly pilin Flp
MRRTINSIRQFLAGECGATAVEYAVMLALIIAVAVVAIDQLGQATYSAFCQAMMALQ